MHFRTDLLALWISAASFAISTLTWILAEVRRWERITIRATFDHRFVRGRDDYLYPIVSRVEHLAPSERCVRLVIRYRGRHSMRLRAVYFELVSDQLYPVPLADGCTLFDGQTKSFLLPARKGLAHEDITGFVIETESHGNRIKRVHYRKRMDLWLLKRHFGLWRLLRSVREATGKATGKDKMPGK